MSDTVIALPSTARAFELPRDITAEEWDRYRGYVGEILTALGLPPDMPGTRRHPSGSCVRSTTRPPGTRVTRSS